MLDLSKMVMVCMPISNRNPGRMITISNEGMIAANGILRKELEEKTQDMQVVFYRSEDFKEIILINELDEKNRFRLHKDGRIKYPEFADEMKKFGYNFPAKYIVTYDSEDNCWRGKLEEVPELKNAKQLVKNAGVKRTTVKREKKNV